MPFISIKGIMIPARMRRLNAGSFRLLCLLPFVAACGLSSDRSEDPVCLVIGSSQITVTRLQRDLTYICAGMEAPAVKRELIKDQLLEQCINHYLVLEYAQEQDIRITEQELKSALKDIRRGYSDNAFNESLLRGYVDLEQWNDRLKELLLLDKIIEGVTERIPQPGYQEIKQYYESNPDEFRFPKMIEFRQIVTRSREEADGLLKRLHQGEPMSDIAAKHSIAPEAEKGGRVGWLAEGQLIESMEKILFSLPVNTLSPVIETPYGYHIFEVLAARPEGKKDLADVIGDIQSRLLVRKRKAYLKKWLQELRSHFDVEINQDLITNLMFSENPSA